MLYNEIFGEKLSALGFGAMRLPILHGGKNTDIDQKQVNELIRYALENGINYFDTAYPYHGCMSEGALGKALSAYPRDSFFLADKYPGHQIASHYDPAATFAVQLNRCGVDYFDFYLLHNVNESSIKTYGDPRWGIFDYFAEQKRLGRIRHFGCSYHGSAEMLESFLRDFGDKLDFIQIQLNYLDWSMQNAKRKYEIITEYGLPIWVMEPVRGGKLAKMNDEFESRLKAVRPDESIPAWGFRFLQSLPNVKMVLSGMTHLDQMVDNVKTFSDYKPLNDEEKELVFSIAEVLKNAVPCTGCRYCCDGCPKHLNIPQLISIYNDHNFSATVNNNMRLEAISPDAMPDSCIGCGKCKAVCPQGIDVPNLMKKMAETFSAFESWSDICKAREEALRKLTQAEG